MEIHPKVFARAVLASFLLGSALCCVPFVSFLRAGGDALLMGMKGRELAIENPTLTASEWSAVVKSPNAGCMITFLWGASARSSRHCQQTSSDHQVIETVLETGYGFCAQNDRYTLYYLSAYPNHSDGSQLSALAQLFCSDFRVMSGSLRCLDWLREYRQSANYVGNTWGSIADRDDPNKAFMLVVHLWQVMLQWLLFWQLPLLAVLAACKWSALMWGWIAIEMVGALFLIRPWRRSPWLVDRGDVHL